MYCKHLNLSYDSKTECYVCSKCGKEFLRIPEKELEKLL